MSSMAPRFEPRLTGMIRFVCESALARPYRALARMSMDWRARSSAMSAANRRRSIDSHSRCLMTLQMKPTPGV